MNLFGGGLRRRLDYVKSLLHWCGQTNYWMTKWGQPEGQHCDCGQSHRQFKENSEIISFGLFGIDVGSHLVRDNFIFY